MLTCHYVSVILNLEVKEINKNKEETKMMKKVMKKAVKIARGYEGDWVARMKMALKMAWAIVKRENNKELAVVKENNKFDIF